MPGVFDFSESGDGPAQAAVGKCHIVITEEPTVIGKSMKVVGQAVAHEDAESVGRQVTGFFPTSGRGAGKTLELFFATGVWKRDAYLKAKEDGVELPEPSMDSFVGKSYCTVLEENENPKTGRIYHSPGWTILDPLDPAADGYPKDSDYMPVDDVEVLF